MPVGSVLQESGMGVGPCCKRCGALETPIHILLFCPFAASVWDEVPGNFKPNSTTTTSIPMLIQVCRRMVTLPPSGLGEVPLYPWILWNLWTNRNKLLFEDKRFSVEETVLKSIQDARKWKAAQDSLSKKTLPHRVVLTLLPTHDHDIRIFTDAAWNPTSRSCGLGWRVQQTADDSGSVFLTHRHNVASALVAEALAIKAAIAWAATSYPRTNVQSWFYRM